LSQVNANSQPRLCVAESRVAGLAIRKSGTRSAVLIGYRTDICTQIVQTERVYQYVVTVPPERANRARPVDILLDSQSTSRLFSVHAKMDARCPAFSSEWDVWPGSNGLDGVAMKSPSMTAFNSAITEGLPSEPSRVERGSIPRSSRGRPR
jgi:hypothetical protein